MSKRFCCKNAFFWQRCNQCSFFLLIFIINYVTCEWFSSLGQMEDLARFEMYLSSSLHEYVEAEEEKLAKLKEFLNGFGHISKITSSNLEQYVSHPINQHRLLMRLTFDWLNVKDLVSQNYSKAFLSKLHSKLEFFPDEEDVKGSAQALMRLQDTYKLDTHQLAQGVVKGMISSQPLTTEDCFSIGRYAYWNKNFHHCVSWMKEVLRRDVDTFQSFKKFDVLDHLSYCLAQIGRIDEAFNITKNMLQIDPENQRTLDNIMIYKTWLSNGTDINNVFFDIPPPTRPWIAQYEKLCRGETESLPLKVERRLKCYLWNNNNHPRLLLQPVKLEELWDSPHLVRFYDIVTDYEIDVIKSIAKPRLYRATVHNSDTGKLEHAHYRVSKSSWLTESDHSVVTRVCQRITDVTGLSMETAESLQIANYGIGGQYEPHFDYIGFEKNIKPDEGNRIATFLIYLSNIDYGGSTVFLHPGIAVRPIKRSAAFWFNLFPSGATDSRTKHAACPVLAGVKWVANKWIHERGQEFRRRCGIHQTQDNRLF